MKTTKSMTFMQIILLLNCLIFSTLPILLSAQQLSGSITSVTDSEGNELGGSNPKTGEIYTVEFTGEDIKDIHIKLGTETAEVCYHEDSIPATAGADCDIDVYPGSFSESDDHIEDGPSNARNGKYISLWNEMDSIDSGSFQIRINKGTPGKAIIIVATSDGDSDPWDGTMGVDYTVILPDGGVSYPPTLISTEEVPTLSEWGVITLILLTLSLGMVFLYRRETALALTGNIPTGTSASKQKLFDKRLYAKVFGVVLLTGFAILGLSYLYFGEITSADPFGTFVSSAIVAYMVHLWMLKKSESE